MFRDFEKKIDYIYKNKDMLKQAFTHSSYAYENKLETYHNNERLEFLGDAVLELSISNYLYNIYPKLPEGELTKIRATLVCEQSLSNLARQLDLGKYLLLGNGEEQTGGKNRDSILADVFEAVIGSIYIDSSFEVAEKFVIDMLKPFVSDSIYGDFDYKSTLQEHYQKFSQIPLKYEIIDQSGPDHEKTFTARLTHNNIVLGTGKGRTKKEAEQRAAFSASEKINQK